MVMSDSKHQVAEEEGDVDEEAGVEEEDVVVGEDKISQQFMGDMMWKRKELGIMNEVPFN
jgi:hypothetical protein